jgi:MutS domain V
MRPLMSDPRLIYTQRLTERRADLAVRERRHRLLGNLQLAVVAAALIMVVAALAYQTFSIAWAAIPGAIFVVCLVIHDRLLRMAEFRRRAVRYFERALARLDGKWAGTGERGDSYLDPAHPYAQDLDLFGSGSLFELLCTARTHIGEDTLARWLLEPADPLTIQARNQAVDELRPLVDLREDLAVLAEEARTGLNPVALAAWGEAPALLGHRDRIRMWMVTVVGLAGAVGLILYSLSTAHLLNIPERSAALLLDFFVLAMLATSFYRYRTRKAVEEVVNAVESAAHGIGLVSEVLVRLEREQFRSPLLARLRQSLDTDSDPPSRRLALLRRLTDFLDSRANVFVQLLEFVTLWTPHCAYSIEEWRRRSGPAVRRWLAATGEMEALCSLANHAFEHPADPFPEFTSESPWLDAHGVAHPLLDEKAVVRNDVQLGSGLRLLVVSGSNMSGKSTLLRTLGANVVLAQAGAPVRATRLALSPLAIGASIRVVDSLQNGISRFYAEILRIRQILDQTSGPLPVLFLVDEFLNGTNSHDRRIGAEALVRGLVERGAMGLFTTHDLALADIAEGLGKRAANVHFEDRIENGQIHFDYVMRPGVVRKSNAIELMRSVGLEI